MTASRNPYDGVAAPDEENKEMAEFLGGDVFAYRIARALRRDDITTTAMLRRVYEAPRGYPGAPQGDQILDIPNLGMKALRRVADALSRDSVRPDEEQTP